MSNDQLRPIIIHVSGNAEQARLVQTALAEHPTLGDAFRVLIGGDSAAPPHCADLVVECVGEPMQYPTLRLVEPEDDRRVIVLGDMMDSISRCDLLLYARDMADALDLNEAINSPPKRFTGFTGKRSKKQRRNHR